MKTKSQKPRRKLNGATRYPLMPEHFHVLIKPELSETTPLIMKGLKEESAKRIIRTLRENL